MAISLLQQIQFMTVSVLRWVGSLHSVLPALLHIFFLSGSQPPHLTCEPTQKRRQEIWLIEGRGPQGELFMQTRNSSWQPPPLPPSMPESANSSDFLHEHHVNNWAWPGGKMKQNLIKANTTSVGQMESLLPWGGEGRGQNQHQTPAAPHDSPDITQRGSSVPQMHPLHPHGNVKAVLRQRSQGGKRYSFWKAVHRNGLLS